MALNTVCSHQKKFDGRFCLDIVHSHQAQQSAWRWAARFAPASRTPFSLNSTIPNRKGMRSHVSCAFNLLGMLDEFARRPGNRLHPVFTRGERPPYFSTDSAHDVALSMKLNLLRSNKF
jgi:hypothetical protein